MKSPVSVSGSLETNENNQKERKREKTTYIGIFEACYGTNLPHILSHIVSAKALGFKYGTDTQMVKKNTF